MSGLVLRTLVRLRPRTASSIARFALAGLLFTGTASAQSPSFNGLGQLPGGQSSSVTGISADGSVVVGSALNAANAYEAFRWNQGAGMVGLGFLPGGGFQSAAQAASSDGSVIVGTSDIGGQTQAFRWTSGDGMTGLGYLPKGSLSGGAGVSYDGSVVVGTADSASGQQAYRWTQKDGMVGLGFIETGVHSTAFGVSADGSVVVGEGDTPDANSEAFRWTQKSGMEGLGTLGARPRFENEGGSSAASAVSADGFVLVGGASDGKFNEAFRWTEKDGMVGLGMLAGGNFSDARAVSGDGSVIVGLATNKSNIDEAIYWTPLAGMRTVRDILTTDLGIDLGGWSLDSAMGVSADGLTIVGNGTNPLGQQEAWIAHIPEPATAMLLLIAGSVICPRRRR